MKTKKKYEDGGKVTGADIRNAKKQAKLDRIKAGTEPSGYEKAATITGNVAKVAGSAAEVANAVRDTRSGMTGPGGMKKGGAVKKYQDGGYIRVKGKTGAKDSITKSRTTMSGGTKTKTISGGPMVPNAVGKVTKTKTNADGTLNRSSVKSISGDRAMNKISKYKTGGMVNSNAKVSALKSAGSHGVKSGVNPKAAASKVARGRVGGTSSAPKTAVPKAKYGMVMRKK